LYTRWTSVASLDGDVFVLIKGKIWV